MTQEPGQPSSQPEAPRFPEIAALIHRRLPNIPFTASWTTTDVDIRVEPLYFLDFARGLKDDPELDFDFLNNLTGVDMQDEGLEAKYYFASYRAVQGVQVTVPTPPGDPHIPSLAGLYRTADWHEREAAEMFGFVFDGHPNPKNLLLDEDVHIHPLLKAHPLAKAEILQGIEDTTAGFKF